MSLFKAFADAGDEIIKFIRKGKGNAILIGLLVLISPINIILWVLLMCSIYRTKK